MVLRGAAAPPVEGRLLGYAASALDVVYVAELPELLGRAGVLEEEAVDVGRIPLPLVEAVEGVADLREQPAWLLLVGVDRGLPRCLTG